MTAKSTIRLILGYPHIMHYTCLTSFDISGVVHAPSGRPYRILIVISLITLKYVLRHMVAAHSAIMYYCWLPTSNPLSVKKTKWKTARKQYIGKFALGARQQTLSAKSLH